MMSMRVSSENVCGFVNILNNDDNLLVREGVIEPTISLWSCELLYTKTCVPQIAFLLFLLGMKCNI